MKRFVEPQRDVMRRLYFNRSGVSLSSSEPRLLTAASELVAEGYLVDGGPFYAGGQTYRHFKPTAKVDMTELREI